MALLRVYVDTSVFGGCFDNEFREESTALLDMAREGRVVLVVSDLLVEELFAAPPHVRAMAEALPDEWVERISTSPESERLRDSYLEAGVVGPRSRDDAHHVAVATVAGVDMIVSWNFKHIVHYDKIRGFNAVNLREDYPGIEIYSPQEVV